MQNSNDPVTKPSTKRDCALSRALLREPPLQEFAKGFQALLEPAEGTGDPADDHGPEDDEHPGRSPNRCDIRLINQCEAVHRRDDEGEQAEGIHHGDLDALSQPMADGDADPGARQDRDDVHDRSQAAHGR